MKLLLHNYWRSSASYRVRIGLGLKELAYEYVAVDITRATQHGDSYRAKNPMAQVPALELIEDDGSRHVLVQSLPILEYLDERWPEHVTPEMLRTAGIGYLEHLESRFPGAARVCDKRPDNFLFLGLLKALFPRLRVLHTVRESRDTCLSIYFQQFGDALSYAADLGDIAHYQREYRRLMRHWRRLMEESILDVHYGRLVADPERELREVCRFLGLDWHAGMLDFRNTPSRVRTASVWQVRQPLYTRSLGRWRHYAGQLGALGDLMTEDANDR